MQVGPVLQSKAPLYPMPGRGGGNKDRLTRIVLDECAHLVGCGSTPIARVLQIQMGRDKSRRPVGSVHAATANIKRKKRQWT
uniref:Uncharacterized protein n=1 Tax=Hyaloperonospora arabidopsidis (strain Emoy2) TaxID=559515 RepID=M4BDG9_HYAAE